MRKREEPYERYRRLMPKTQDLTLIVLKGHLLIEEQFDFFLEELSHQPELLEQTRLTFMQKFRLMQALSGLAREDEICQFVERINKLRNKMAHAAEVGALNDMVDDALRAMFRDEFFPPQSARERAKFLRQSFALAIAFVRGHADGFTIAVRTLLHDLPRIHTPR
jgi:hypothetical protein